MLCSTAKLLTSGYQVRIWTSLVCLRRLGGFARNEVEGQDDLIEVELTEIQTLDGQWDKETVGDEVFFVTSPTDMES